MASIQERLQIKREPLDKWSIREQLCLAVARINDQNLTSVSRALKPFGEPNRPADWFHQKNCAAQYGALLANVETPKRKKRTSGVEVVETPAESILRKLLAERKAEIQKLLAEEKAEYLKLQADMIILQSGKVTEEQLDIWCKEIDEEEQRKDQEAVAHAQWLKERELKKQEIERAWRPLKPVVSQRRKNSETVEIENVDSVEENQPIEPAKPALSPLLTSLLKSPSQVPQNVNVTTPSILHSAITHQRAANTSPTIASLLNSSATITVSPGIQQLVSSAIGQEPIITNSEQNTATQIMNANDMLDDQNLNNLKIDDLANSILVQDGPLPEIKNDVDGLISDLIDSAQDIVEDPEQHLQLDGNGDINLNIELDDLEETENEDIEPKVQVQQEQEPQEQQLQHEDNQQQLQYQSPQEQQQEINQIDKQPKIEKTVDPFEFQEDPEIFEPAKTVLKSGDLINKQYQYQPQPEKSIIDDNKTENEEDKNCQINLLEDDKNLITKEQSNEIDKNVSNENQIINNTLVNIKIEENDNKSVDDENNKNELIPTTTTTIDNEKSESPLKTNDGIKNETEINIDVSNIEPSTTLTSDFHEELYDDLNMEVKVDKSGKAKRDYSRTKKRDDKEDGNFDTTFLSLTKRDDGDLVDDTFSDFDKDQKSTTSSTKNVKSENERSNSPWTEEDDALSIRAKRRLSTPATPVDSVPNSPASSIAYFDDDREYKNWKKSILLVYNRLATNKYASLFLKPITNDQAPGYHNIVYRPMDLSTIRKNIDNYTIRTTQEFKRDVMLMLNNAIMFNKTNDTVYNMARQMQQESMQQIQILLQAQSQVDTPLRRETRTSEPGAKRKRGTEEIIRNKKRKED